MTGAARQGGLGNVEVLVATVLIAIAIVPAIEALDTALVGTRAHGQQARLQLRAAGRMEEVLAEPFEALDGAALAAGGPGVPSGYSDPADTPDRRLVYLARYDADDADADADPFTGGDDGLVWVRVQIEHSAVALEALSAR